MRAPAAELLFLSLVSFWAALPAGGGAAVHAQEAAAAESGTNGPAPDAVRTRRHAFVAENMGLTEEQAAAFWPVYNGYRASLGRVTERTMRLLADFANDYEEGTLTKKQARNLMEELLSIERAKIKVKRTYVKRFCDVLPPEQALQLFRLENEMDGLLRAEAYRAFPLPGPQGRDGDGAVPGGPSPGGEGPRTGGTVLNPVGGP